MQDLQQQLKVVHDELTHLMAGSRLDSLSRSKLASASNRLLEISQQLEAESTKKALSEIDPAVRRTIVKTTMGFLAWLARLLRDIVMTRCGEDGS